MRLCVLGSSSATPTRARNCAALLIDWPDGRLWLFDCAEGTQHQILRSPYAPGRIERIFISHLHADHCLGLPGLLCAIDIGERRDALHLIGPRGLRSWIEHSLFLTATRLGFPLYIHELPDDGPLDAPLGYRAQAFLLPHVLPSWAYYLQSPEQRGRLDIVQARALGVPDGPLLGALARGHSVLLPDGRTIDPAPLLGVPKRGTRLLLCADTTGAAVLAQRVPAPDVLVHECTYAQGAEAKAQQWGHSTALAAGQAAAALRAQSMLLTHFSARHSAPDAAIPVEALVQQAASQTRCPLLAAEDLCIYRWDGRTLRLEQRSGANKALR